MILRGSPYSLETVQLGTHLLVEIYPNVGVGEALHFWTQDLFACTSAYKPVVEALQDDTQILVAPDT